MDVMKLQNGLRIDMESLNVPKITIIDDMRKLQKVPTNNITFRRKDNDNRPSTAMNL